MVPLIDHKLLSESSLKSSSHLDPYSE